MSPYILANSLTQFAPGEYICSQLFLSTHHFPLNSHSCTCLFCAGRCHPQALLHFSGGLTQSYSPARPDLSLCAFSPSCLELLPVPSLSLKGCLPKSNPSACFIFSIWFLYALGIRLLLLSCCLGNSIVQQAWERQRFAFLVLTARARNTTGGRHFAQSCAIWLLQSGKPQLSIYSWGLLTLSSFVLFFFLLLSFPSCLCRVERRGSSPFHHGNSSVLPKHGA